MSRRGVVAGLGLGVLAAAAAVATPRRPLAFGQHVALADLAPLRVGPWLQNEDPKDIIAERLEDIEASDRTLLFSYAAPGQSDIMLALSYHSPVSRDVKVHRPEICYRSAGFQLSQGRDVPLILAPRLTVPARLFTAHRGMRRETVLYWTRVAQAFPTTAFQQRLATMSYGLQGRSVDGLLVRMSILEATPSSGEQTMTIFAAALFAAVGAGGRALMVADRRPG